MGESESGSEESRKLENLERVCGWRSTIVPGQFLEVHFTCVIWLLFVDFDYEGDGHFIGLRLERRIR
jgi:hypothetical protein